jgi:hypothetical protein
MQNPKKALIEWQQATNKLAQVFVEKYYGKECVDDYYWVDDAVGDILVINDEFWGLDRVKETLELSAEKKKLFDYYYHEIELTIDGDKPAVNFRNYIRYGKELK